MKEGIVEKRNKRGPHTRIYVIFPSFSSTTYVTFVRTNCLQQTTSEWVGVNQDFACCSCVGTSAP